ncbi:MAG: hypothetical protein SFY80_15115 [Verrucomicrobiota bacterium]|nr:hypothetical protein [Verrucomicrobiota bacterium]
MRPNHKNPILAERIIRKECIVDLHPALIKISGGESSLLIGHWPDVQFQLKRKLRSLNNDIDRPLGVATAQWEWGGMPVLGDKRQTYFDLLGINPLSPCAPTLIEREILATIPLRIRNLLRQETGGDLQLLVLFAKAPAAIELCENNPSLLYLLRNRLFRRMPPSAWDSICKLPQRKLHDLLKIPSTASFVKILRKTRVDCSTLHDGACVLVGTYEDGGRMLKYLCHLPKINDLHFLVMLDPILAEQVSYNFMLDACVETRSKYLALDKYNSEYWREIPGEKEPHFSSFKEMHQWLRKQSAWEKKLLASHEGEFPSPPFPGTPNIQPITNPEELEREGEVQHNCASNYMLPIIMRLSYMYRVLKPRATLLVTRNPGHSQWRVRDIKLACNEPLSRSMVEELSFQLTGDEHSKQIMCHSN